MDVAEGRMEGKGRGGRDNRKIDLIYEFSTTSGTDLHFCHVSDFSSRFDKLVIDLLLCSDLKGTVHPKIKMTYFYT